MTDKIFEALKFILHEIIPFSCLLNRQKGNCDYLGRKIGQDYCGKYL
jgi:hypothetical protein